VVGHLAEVWRAMAVGAARGAPAPQGGGGPVEDRGGGLGGWECNEKAVDVVMIGTDGGHRAWCRAVRVRRSTRVLPRESTVVGRWLWMWTCRLAEGDQLATRVVSRGSCSSGDSGCAERVARVQAVVVDVVMPEYAPEAQPVRVRVCRSILIDRG